MPHLLINNVQQLHLITTQQLKHVRTVKKTNNMSRCKRNAFQLSLPQIQRQNTSSWRSQINFWKPISTFQRLILKGLFDSVIFPNHLLLITLVLHVQETKSSTSHHKNAKMDALKAKFSVKQTHNALMQYFWQTLMLQIYCRQSGISRSSDHLKNSK